MKIGIDIRTLMDRNYSGVPEYTLNLLKAIFKLDHENEYRLFYNNAKDISGRMPKFDYPNVKIIKTRYPNKVLNYFLFKPFNAPKIDKMLDVDLFFMPHFNFIGLSGRAKSILTIHDLSFLRYGEYFSSRKNFWHKMVNVKKIVNKFDYIVAVSESTKNDLIDLFKFDPEKIKVIYSGVGDEYKKIDLENPSTKNKTAEIINKYSLPEKFILFLGTIEPRKNIEGLISAYDKLRSNNEGLAEYKLIIAGGRGWKSGKIYEAVKKSKYKDDIIFTGYIENDEKLYFYNLASLFAYPSFYEGFGFPPLEAMACGTPIISSFSSSLPEIAGDSGILINPYNSDDLAKAMEDILTNPRLKEDLVNKGFERIKLFNWENTAKEYLDLFKNASFD